MTEQDYITGDFEAAGDLWEALEYEGATVENVDLTPSPDAEAQRQSIGIVIRQQAIRRIIEENNLNSTADWTGYDG